jgi:HSP20 family protein
MSLPVSRRRPLERWRGGWPREFRDPFGEFAQLWNRMGQLFAPAGEAGRGAWVPAVETEQSDDAYLVRAELPGMRHEDIDVELRGNELLITGEVKEDEKASDGGKPLSHRQGKFSYRATLPTDADPEKAEAQLTDGILTVRLPKAPQTRSRRIEVKG